MTHKRHIEGSCLCGTVRWHYDGTFERMTHCHCGMCRKAHAAPFATYAVGPAAPFAFDDGAHAITRRESSPGFVRAFCSTCGAVVPNTDLEGIVAVPAGLVDGDAGVVPGAHIFVRWKAPWYSITDDLPQHDHYPGQAGPAVQRALPPPSTDGRLRGSCLCGAVGFAIEGGFRAVYNCHCSRCRKARAAAHTTNGFVGMEQIEFTRGGDALVTYRLPEARYFSQVFCPACGSGMPRVDPGRGIAVVPFGALDDDPGRGADAHIFVGSKASWYTITDTLPRFDGAPG